MLINNTVKIKKNSNNYKYYNNLNYEVDNQQFFEVKVQDLAKTSHVNVNVKCDICGLEKKISYFSYQRNISSSEENIYTCIKCSKVKSKKTNLEKYGVEYPIQNDDIKNRRKFNNQKKYGVDEPSKLEECIKKVKATKKEKYGDDKYNNLEKIRTTKVEKYNDVRSDKKNKF